MTRKAKYGTFSKVAKLMVSRDSRWCVKHYREVFKRVLFTEKLDHNVRRNIIERVIQFQSAGFDFSSIVKYIQ